MFMIFQMGGEIKVKKLGSGALSGKIFLVKIIENNKIYAHFRAG